MRYYNYFRPGSEPALNTSLADAYESGEAWVGYNWEPTWVMGRYDLTLLKEPEFNEQNYYEGGYTTEIPSMEVTISVNQSLDDRAPEVTEFLSNYETSSEITSEVLAYMEENDVDEREAAKYFFDEY
ncbi:glycine betaine ABC transporter substrate-binding protein [Natranaerobius trueperi]|uniref:glycine betaine ABC transporter substrate-binding protein n=1 Tax=Natranaerobius trueperi TaxID=759412 RepID=UPI00197BD896|nr:glycine betaine ABC transporter substrate-binding protein [Natranaerobius trueperi]